MTAAHRKQIDAAFSAPEPTEAGEASKSILRSAGHGFSSALADHCPPGRHLAKALQLAELAVLMAAQGVDANPGAPTAAMAGADA